MSSTLVEAKTTAATISVSNTCTSAFRIPSYTAFLSAAFSWAVSGESVVPSGRGIPPRGVALLTVRPVFSVVALCDPGAR